MSYDNNPYYHPEKLGLTLVGSTELSEPSWSFDTLAVWKDDAGFYLGTDSGCYCPSPFESYNGRDDLTGPLTLEQAIEEAESIRANSYQPTYDQLGWDALITDMKEASA